jgi:hypothetical protein
MPKLKKPTPQGCSLRSTFILDLPLVVQPAADRVMIGRFEAGRRLLNAVLDEALKRLALMRESNAWRAARLMPKSAGAKARADAFRACNERFGFSEYALQAVASKHKNAAGWQDRLGAHETQKIATRVWSAIEEYAFGKRGKPRFKGKNRPLHSLEGKSNATGIRWKADVGCVTWNGLILPVKMPNRQQDPYVHEALKATTKYCRIVWRNLRGERRWFIQLIQDGAAPAKYDFFANGQEVGLDIGPSTIAIVSDEAVALERFAPSIDQPWTKMRQIQRAMDRSRRATNPDNYNVNGTSKKGARKWKRSSGYRTWQVKLSELERKLAAGRKRDHGTLANNILGLGNVIKTEALSYKAFQRCFGRSAKVRASGTFVSLLTRKAESAGGKVIELNTCRLRMSQFDHQTNSCTKKPLKQRWHRLGGRTTLVQRDCYSAFLAKFAQGSEHNLSILEEGWTAAEPLLSRAKLCLEESAKGMPSGSHTVPVPSERIARQRRFVRSLARDAVAATREPGDPAHVRL